MSSLPKERGAPSRWARMYFDNKIEKFRKNPSTRAKLGAGHGAEHFCSGDR
jgi:hypothetical protein